MSIQPFKFDFSFTPEDRVSIERAIAKSLRSVNDALRAMRKTAAVLQRGQWSPEKDSQYIRTIASQHRTLAKRHLDREVTRVRKELGLPCD